VPLSNAEKVRRHRQRRKEAEEVQERLRRGLSPKAPEPEVPEGAYLTSNGFLRPIAGWYERGKDRFVPIPDDILQMTYTLPDGSEDIVPEQYARFLAVQRGMTPTR
jgi:hypothetical protein